MKKICLRMKKWWKNFYVEEEWIRKIDSDSNKMMKNSLREIREYRYRRKKINNRKCIENKNEN